MDPSEPTDEALQPLTPAAERALVARHQRFLAFLRRRVDSAEEAEELLQSALVRTLETGSAPKAEEDAVAWFYRVLRNALVDRARRRNAEARALERTSREVDARAEDPELRDAVCACMHGLLPGLKPEYAELVRQVDLEERAVGEVADELGLTRNNAAVRLHRARQALKRQLERACGSCATHGCLECSCAKRREVPRGPGR